MAINFDLLIPLSTIGQFMIDELTTTPLLGEVFFYEPDKITLKNVYEQTGDLPPNNFQVTPNPIQLNAAGGFVNASGNIFIPYLYLFNEVDNETSQLYYVEVRRTDSSLAWALDLFGENYPGSQPEEAGEITNLCPTYGFDIPIFRNFYTQENEQPIRNWLPATGPTVVDLVRGWRWTNNGLATSNFFAEFEEITAGSIAGNPLFKLKLTQTTFGTPGTTNWLGFELTKGNNLQGKDITFQIHVEDSSGTLGSYNVGVVTHNASNTVTNVGILPVTSVFLPQVVTFQMPDVSGLIESINEIIYLVIELPFAFPIAAELSFSATLATIGDAVIADEDIPISNSGTNAATQFWSNLGSGFWQEPDDWSVMGLPFSSGKGNIQCFDDVGNVWTGANNEAVTYENASSLPLDGRTIVTNQPLLATLTDRFLGASLAHVGGNSFVVTSVNPTEIDVALRTASLPFTPWASSTAAITIGTSAGTGIPEITVTSQVANVLNIAFSNAAINVDRTERSFKESYILPLPPFDGLGYDTRNINDMVGVFNITTTTIPAALNFVHNTNLHSVNVGPATPALATLTFSPGGIGAPDNIQSARQTIHVGDEGDQVVVYRNYLCFLQIPTPGTAMPIAPPVVIQFHVNGQGIQIPSTSHTYTVNYVTADLSSGTALATKLAAVIDTSIIHTITVNSLPANGEFLELSTGNASFIMIFHDTAFAKPINPIPTRPPIFIEYITTGTPTTLAQLTTKIANALTTKIGCIPTVTDLKLTPLDPNSDLQYYVRV